MLDGTAPHARSDAEMLRSIAQDLTRTDPDLLSEPGRRCRLRNRPDLVEFAVYLPATFVIGALVTRFASPLLAIVVGAGLLVVATIRASTRPPSRVTGPRGEPTLRGVRAAHVPGARPERL